MSLVAGCHELLGDVISNLEGAHTKIKIWKKSITKLGMTMQ